MSLESRLKESADYIKNILSTKNFPIPSVAIILGSGSKGFEKSLENFKLDDNRLIPRKIKERVTRPLFFLTFCELVVISCNVCRT